MPKKTDDATQDVRFLTNIAPSTLDAYKRVAAYHGKSFEQWLLDAVQAHAWRSIKAIPADMHESVLEGESLPVLYSVE